jgi:hypothetical protein
MPSRRRASAASSIIAATLAGLAARLKPPRLYRPSVPPDQAAEIAALCAPVAARYGY